MAHGYYANRGSKSSAVRRVSQACVRSDRDYRPDFPTVMNIGDSMIMISEAGIRKPMPAFLYVYVADADQIYRRAIEAGATSLEEPSVMPYGDRRGMVEDAWGNIWQIATYARSYASER